MFPPRLASTGRTRAAQDYLSFRQKIYIVNACFVTNRATNDRVVSPLISNPWRRSSDACKRWLLRASLAEPS